MIAREAANAAARRYAAGARNFLTDMLGSTIGLCRFAGYAGDAVQLTTRSATTPPVDRPAEIPTSSPAERMTAQG